MLDAAVFDVEYGRWVEEHHRMMSELQAAVQEHLPENELRLFVDNCLAHFNEMMNLKNMILKTDVFHLISGAWKTPAERCFMWMGGFRPSHLIKVYIVDVYLRTYIYTYIIHIMNRTLLYLLNISNYICSFTHAILIIRIYGYLMMSR